VKLYKSDSHHRNFLDCVKSRQPTIYPGGDGAPFRIPGHLGLISDAGRPEDQVGRGKEVILGDAEASKLLTRPYRSPWKLA